MNAKLKEAVEGLIGQVDITLTQYRQGHTGQELKMNDLNTALSACRDAYQESRNEARNVRLDVRVSERGTLFLTVNGKPLHTSLIKLTDNNDESYLELTIPASEFVIEK